MWKNAEFYGRVGPPIQDEAILHAELYGLPLAARDWLKDDATGDGVDVFDAENNGAEMFTPADMFGLLDKWHKKLPASEKNGKGGGHNDRKPGDNNNRNNNNNNNNHRNDDERKRKHNHRDRGTKRQKFNNNNNETKKASDFDTKPCHIHGGHQWMDCRLAHGKKNFNEQQANNFAQRAGAETRDKFAWWFTTHEKKDWWKKKTNGGVTQQQYFGGQLIILSLSNNMVLTTSWPRHLTESLQPFLKERWLRLRLRHMVLLTSAVMPRVYPTLALLQRRWSTIHRQANGSETPSRFRRLFIKT